MKFQHLATLLLLLTAATATAQTQTQPADLTTLSGHVYKAARPGTVEPDGITYFYAGGVSKIPFTDLPEAVRKQYGYDPTKAAAFAAADEQGQMAAYQNAQAAIALANQKKGAAEAARLQSVAVSQQAAANQVHTGSALDAPATQHVPLDGVVMQVVDDGLLVSHGKSIFLLEKYPQQSTVITDARVHLMAEPSGSYDYETTEGSNNTVRKYRFLSGSVTNPR